MSMSAVLHAALRRVAEERDISDDVVMTTAVSDSNRCVRA